MKRDLDLCRRILLAIEEHPDAELDYEPEFDGVPSGTVTYHVTLLRDAGMLNAEDASHTQARAWIALTLTTQGHEFLDAARDDTLWTRAKSQLGEKVKLVSLGVLHTVLVDVAKSALGLPK